MGNTCTSSSKAASNPAAVTVAPAANPKASSSSKGGIRRVLVLRNAVTGAASVSNKGCDKAIAAVKAAYPKAVIIERDLVKNQVPFLNEENTEAIRNHTLDTPAQRAADRLANELVEELKSVDLLIVGLPRYNFGVPTSFKTYLDFIARPRITFRYGANGPEGLLPNIPVWAVMSAGGIYGPDHYGEWLSTVLGFVGLVRISYLYLEGSAMSSAGDIFAKFDAELSTSVKALK